MSCPCPTAPSSSDGRTGGCCPRCHRRRRCRPIRWGPCGPGMSRRGSGCMRGRDSRDGWGSGWTSAGQSACCIPWPRETSEPFHHQTDEARRRERRVALFSSVTIMRRTDIERQPASFSRRSRMTKIALRQVLAEWLNERQRNLSPENSVHIHVDEVMKRLGRHHYHPVLALLEPYEVVIDLLGDLVNEVIPSLVIPLSTPDDSEMSIRGLLSPPDIQHLETELIRERLLSTLRIEGTTSCPEEGRFTQDSSSGCPLEFQGTTCSDRPFLRSILGKQYPGALRPRAS